MSGGLRGAGSAAYILTEKLISNSSSRSLDRHGPEVSVKLNLPKGARVLHFTATLSNQTEDNR